MEDLLMTILKIVITTVVTVGTTALMYLFKKYVYEMIDKNIKGETADALKKGVELIADSVDYVQQTYVDILKREDQFSKEAQQKAFNAAKDRAIALMNTDIQNQIEGSYGNLDLYVETVIESLVSKRKK